MNSDPISDFLTRIRNASMVNKSTVSIPHSKFKHELSKLLKTEGYISDVKVNGESSQKELQIDLKYSENGSPVLAGLNRLSKPGPGLLNLFNPCLLYTSPSPRDRTRSRMPSSA